MLDGLRDNLRSAIKKIVKSSGVDEEVIGELARDVQRALLLADVNVALVAKITESLKGRALGEAPPPGLSRKDHVVKILYDELSGLMGGGGGDESEIPLKAGGTTRIVMLGIQGSGKTTTAAKLARHLTGQGRTVGAIGADTHRPGALVQLRTMCERSGVEVYGEEGGTDSPRIVRNGIRHFGDAGPEVLIIDTAGRHKEERALLEEMGEIGRVAEPDLALLVIDGTSGQQCRSQAEAFHGAVPVGGIAVSKMDSSAKGGGAIAASAATGARIMYIGTGERIDDLERFSPTRFVGRILGMGDVQAVLDLAKRLENEADDVRMKRISTGRMNMDDFFYQLEEVTKMGSLRGLIDSMPGLSGKVKGDQLDQVEDKMDRWRFIIQSMTVREKEDPGLLNTSRIQRIARGSGWSQQDVKELMKNYKNSKSIMKASRGRQMQGMLRRMGMG